MLIDKALVPLKSEIGSLKSEMGRLKSDIKEIKLNLDLIFKLLSKE
jgi:hypothetical protein